MGKKPNDNTLSTAGATIRNAKASQAKKRASAAAMGSKGGTERIKKLRKKLGKEGFSKRQADIAKLRPPIKKPGPRCACGRNTKARALARWPDLKGKHCMIGTKGNRRPCTAADSE